MQITSDIYSYMHRRGPCLVSVRAKSQRGSIEIGRDQAEFIVREIKLSLSADRKVRYAYRKAKALYWNIYIFFSVFYICISIHISSFFSLYFYHFLYCFIFIRIFLFIVIFSKIMIQYMCFFYLQVYWRKYNPDYASYNCSCKNMYIYIYYPYNNIHIKCPILNDPGKYLKKY